MHIKKYIAETIGTFALTFVVLISIHGDFPIPTPILAGLVLGLFVYSIGHISGTHINPAVTLGVWSIGKIKPADAVYYIIAQFIGALLAMYVAKWSLGVTSALNIDGGKMIILAEALGAFFFTFGIASVVYGKTPSQIGGLVIGGSLTLGIALAVLLGSNGVLNPAVAFGISSFNLMYVIGPIIGSIAGMNAYKYLSSEK